MLTAPRREFGEFTAALAYLPLITPAATLGALEARLADRRAELERIRHEHADAAATLPRLVLIENEYLIAHLETDVAWIAAVVDDLRGGRLDWSYEELVALARRSHP